MRFQCSSASRKFLNFPIAFRTSRATTFQCSSASRKFLNKIWFARSTTKCLSFQCSSASRKFLNAQPAPCSGRRRRVSVLFSEPKIPQCEPARSEKPDTGSVSVLFSEPKIPQFATFPFSVRATRMFQCSSASRKFLNRSSAAVPWHSRRRFQCSSASRKFLNQRPQTARQRFRQRVSVLFSEPKIPQFAAASAP